MERERKRIRKIFWAVVLVGSGAMGSLLASSDLEERTGKLLLLGLPLIIVVAALLINLRWRRNFMKKLEEYNQILFEQRNPDEYIEKINHFFENVQEKSLLDCRNIHLMAAYGMKGDYVRAMEYLETVDPPKLRGVTQGLYWANKSLFCFYLGREAEGRHILEEWNPFFSQYRERTDLGELLDTLLVLEKLSLQDGQGAEAALLLLRKKWENNENQTYFEGLEQLCREAKKEGGNDSESKLG